MVVVEVAPGVLGQRCPCRSVRQFSQRQPGVGIQHEKWRVARHQHASGGRPGTSSATWSTLIALSSTTSIRCDPIVLRYPAALASVVAGWALGSRVATADGFTSLGLWMMSPWPLLAVGGALVAIIAPERWVRWWRLPAHVRRVDRIPTLSVRLEAGGHRTERWREAYERLEAVLETNSAQLARADGHRVLVRCRIGNGRRDAQPDGGKVTGYARKAKLITVTVDLPADPPADADAVLWANVKNAVDRAQQFARDEGLAGDLSDVHECLVDR